MTTMKALISSIEPRETGYRVAQVEADDNVFPVADGLFWADCGPDLVADQFFYDPQDQIFRPIPVPSPLPRSALNEPQPITQGAQTL